MRTNLELFDGLNPAALIPFVEMDIVEFIAKTSIEIHPLFRKLYNPHAFYGSFQLFGISDLMSLQPLNHDNYERTTRYLGIPGVTLAVAASGALYIIAKENPDHVSEWDRTIHEGNACLRAYSAENFIEIYMPTMSTVIEKEY